MHRLTFRIVFALAAVVTLGSAPASADFIEIEDDLEAWQSALSGYTSIYFTEFPVGMVLWDQYIDQGAFFYDGNDIITSAAPDGGGVLGLDQGVGVQFDQPRTAIAVETTESVRYQLFSDGKLIYTSSAHHSPGGGQVASLGILSDEPFDSVRIYNSIFDKFNTFDNLYFGDVIPAPGAMPVLALALLAGRRGRRCAPRQA